MKAAKIDKARGALVARRARRRAGRVRHRRRRGRGAARVGARAARDGGGSKVTGVPGGVQRVAVKVADAED